MADGRHFKNRFGHNSAADFPILVKFCKGKQNSMAIEATLHYTLNFEMSIGGLPLYCKSLNRHNEKLSDFDDVWYTITHFKLDDTQMTIG